MTFVVEVDCAMKVSDDGLFLSRFCDDMFVFEGLRPTRIAPRANYKVRQEQLWQYLSHIKP